MFSQKTNSKGNSLDSKQSSLSLNAAGGEATCAHKRESSYSFFAQDINNFIVDEPKSGLIKNKGSGLGTSS
jgi:hypothetical protein